jgi:tRNA-splicing ligase RtcB (3'-phosphate/5'-hydroxy nucleic acid ligase)
VEFTKGIKKIGEGIWEIPPTAKEGMLVPARIYATDDLLQEMDQGVFNQVTNVACLPGIQKYALCMPDGHWGYGFPIGGVAAMDTKTGVISPGGIGFDINCGMRLLRTDLTEAEVKPKLRDLVDRLFHAIPCGVGTKGFLKLSPDEFREVMTHGAQWVIRRGYGWPEDAEGIENFGRISGADPGKVSAKATSRGIHQLGTLGSGNHYLEIQVVYPGSIYEPDVAKALGIDQDHQVVVMFHCGSRGFGHQVGTDYLEIFARAMQRYGIAVRDKELACAPYASPEGQDYFKAMVCAANSAFANRQVITHRIREVFTDVFKRDARELGLDVIYDVCHDIAKIERYRVNGEEKDLVVHRKGATRSFPPGHPELAARYRDIGQPVIIGGSMETGSYLLLGTATAMEESFGSTAHGSGRTMSRTAAKKKVHGRDLLQRLEQRGIYVRAASFAGVAEEAGMAYKDIAAVVDAVDTIGLSKKVVRLQPIGNIKG